MAETQCAYRAIVLISLDKKKADALADGPDEPIRKRLQPMARALRRQPGVREIHAVRFYEWREGGAVSTRPLWKPVGVLAIVESDDPKGGSSGNRVGN